ncbi:hypothetical protein [Lysobacter silvisoli]|uniref:EF-hand domain-containing protein n=1 Tax=Lysobacter silvisoli TaxID=2293254 RepID=A0A371K029_9GAMM|nr:hypothetical protein [Lysobacter silvisoli]RDZ27212.1 hypothetical protein DX914_13250 [Lysobacter silvisoli]
MRLQIRTPLLAATFALLATPALAQETPKPKPMTSAEKIAVIDADRDGVITAEEHAAGAKKMFEQMDANRDGKVTAAEMDAAHAAMATHNGGKANADDPPPNERPMDNKRGKE